MKRASTRTSVPPLSKISRAEPPPFCTEFLVVNYYLRVRVEAAVQKLKRFWTASGSTVLAAFNPDTSALNVTILIACVSDRRTLQPAPRRSGTPVSFRKEGSQVQCRDMPSRWLGKSSSPEVRG